MKKGAKMMITGITAAVIAAGVLAVIIFISGNSEGSIIGGINETTSLFMAEELPEGETHVVEYKSITMDEARDIFAVEGDYLILDVRRADEFTEGHIPGAINVANEDITSAEPTELPDKEQVIYVYCRSGRRSKEAAAKLAAMGYVNIVEFGGILDWTGEVEK